VRSLVRVLAYSVSAILLLGFLWIAVDRRRQGFHDKIAHTFVIYDRQRSAPVGWSDSSVATFADHEHGPVRALR
jgi:uncharacterized RDD family membrane protein YckC